MLRILAILLAAFLLISSAADILGVLPHSRSWTSFPFRFRQNFVPIVTGILLLVNFRKLKGTTQIAVYLVALFAVNLWYSMIWMPSMATVFLGYRSYHLIPMGLLILAILWGTFWMAINQHFASGRR